MKRTHLIYLSLSMLLVGCQSAPVSYDNPWDNPRSVPPPGSIIELNQPLSFKPNNSHHYVQNGRSIGTGRYDRFTPWCEFYLYESRESLKTERRLEPDRFTVIEAYQRIEYVNAKPVDVAAVGVGFGAPYYSSPFRDDIGPVPMQTTIRVRSEKQPQLHEIKCAVMDDAWLQNWLSVNKIIKTLGSVATLHLPVVRTPAAEADTQD